MSKYNEILELYDYCEKIGLKAVLEEIWDGYAIRFSAGGDVVQHSWSYGGPAGFVEPAIGCRVDYTAVPLKNAKRLLRRHKERLNCEGRQEKEKNKGGMGG